MSVNKGYIVPARHLDFGASNYEHTKKLVCLPSLEDILLGRVSENGSEYQHHHV